MEGLSKDCVSENTDEKILLELTELLEQLQANGKIADLEIESHATFNGQENMVSTYTFNIPQGLTIGKYHKIVSWIEKYYPIVSVRKKYHKHQIVLYYTYDK